MAVSPYLVTEIGIEEVFPLLGRDRLTLKLLKVSSQPLLHRFCVIRKRHTVTILTVQWLSRLRFVMSQWAAGGSPEEA